MLFVQVSHHEPYYFISNFLEAIRSMNKMQFVDENIEEINHRIFKDVTWIFILQFPE